MDEHDRIINWLTRRTADEMEVAAAEAITKLRAELETERMRLVACSVIALANTPESAASARGMHPDYQSPHCDDVARAVDREIALRAENARLIAALNLITAHYDASDRQIALAEAALAAKGE